MRGDGEGSESDNTNTGSSGKGPYGADDNPQDYGAADTGYGWGE